MSRADDLRRMSQTLEMGRPLLERVDAYYRGTQPLAFLTPEVRAAVGQRLQSLVVNWPRLVVDAVEERLDVEGFRLGEEDAPSADLWNIWQANDLDEQSQLAHQATLVDGRAFVIVWGDANGSPVISIESARQVVLERDPATRTRLRAFKAWHDGDGFVRATLFEPDEVTRWRSVSKHPDPGTSPYVPADGWVLSETLPNPLGVVPVVPLVNRPRLLAPEGESELADVLPIADAVNKLLTDLMVTSEYSASQRRWATGIEVHEEPVVDEAGQPVVSDDGEPVMQPARMFDPRVGRVWVAEAPDAKFGAFPEVQLAGFLDAVRTLSHAIASLSGLPPHYLAITAMDNPASADAIRSAEASLVAKAKRKARTWGGAWEEVMRLALLVRDGRLPEGADSMETVWRDPETRTVAQAADAAVKLVQAGILPPEVALEDLGYTPQQVARIRAARRRDALDRVVVDLEQQVAP
jgi:hypothetical protein